MGKVNLSQWAIRHPQLIVFLILAIGLGGAFAYQRLGRAEDPAFTIKNAIVSAVWPGATTEEMQDQVADRIEKKLQELPWVDKIDTYCKPGFSAISFAFRDSTPPRDVPMLFLELRKKMSDLKPDLPADVEGPAVNDELGDVNSVLYTIVGDGASYAQLKEVAEALRKRLQRVPDVTKVDLYGDQAERIFVESSYAKLATLGVPLQAMFDSLAKQNALAPAGEFQTDAQRVPVRVTGALQGVDAVAETPVFANGQTFRLGDIADVSHGYEDPPSYLIRAQGQPALEIGVVMQKGGNILSLGKNLDAALAEFEADLPRGIVISRIADQPEVVDSAVFVFTRSFLEALAIVLGVSFLSLGWRSGIVVATSVPLVLAIVFVVMAFIGLDLQRVTLGALIIALGLLVDDAIIAVEMIVVKLEQGWERERAASFAWTSTAFPMLTGTLVTAAGFVPIGLASSTVGEYAGGIFWVVGIALVASWFVAVLFTPFLGFKLLPKHVRSGHLRDEAAIYSTSFYRAFRRALEFCVARPLVVVVAAVLLLGLGLSQFSKVQQQFFPLSERPELFLEMRLAEGSAIQATQRTAGEAERLLAGDSDIASYTTYIGKSSPRFWLGLLPVQPNEAFAQIVVVAKDVEARERVKARIEAAVAGGALERGAGARRSLQFRPAGRFSRAVSRHRPGRGKGARDRRAGARRHARGSARRRRPSQLGRENAVAAARRGSGARPRAGADAARYRADPADPGRRRDGDDNSRRRGARRRRRPRHPQRARRARSDRRSHHRRAQRRRGSRRPGRPRRADHGGADHLAPESPNRHDRAVRRRQRRAASGRFARAVVEARIDPRKPPAGRPHRDGRRDRGNRRRATHRSSSCSRSWSSRC